jgi:threonylcarbamoyladenosine tRNA methylthiotransferase MtaB
MEIPEQNIRLKRIAIATLGCKTNAYESAAIAGQFVSENYVIVPFNSKADIYIINTCTVTGRTDYKSRNLIRKALARKEENPEVKVVVTGCFAQRNRDEVMKLGAVDLVADNQNKQDIARLIGQTDYTFSDIMQEQEFSYRPVKEMVEHSRAFQKIQDGCDFRCAYCAVPYGRGNSRSASLEDILTQAKLFVESGYKEIVLGGVNLGLYRHGANGLVDVVEALQGLDGLELIRLSSIEPPLFTDELLERIKGYSKLCHHFHIPLQSGCDSVLKRMNRPYGTSMFRELIDRILDSIPNAAIGLDVITGFPGETEDEFTATVKFIESLDIAYLHVFSFSKRPGTPAESMTGQIPNLEKTRRTKALTALSDQKKKIYALRLITGKVELRGICEAVVGGKGTFLSDHYIRAYTDAKCEPGELVRITPLNEFSDGVSDQRLI